jgi:hypothetical protein
MKPRPAVTGVHEVFAGTWINLPCGGRLKVRPYVPALLQTQSFDMFEVFSYCLVDWSGVEAVQGGAPLPLTPSVKRALWDSNIAGIPEFVIRLTGLWADRLRAWLSEETAALEAIRTDRVRRSKRAHTN